MLSSHSDVREEHEESDNTNFLTDFQGNPLFYSWKSPLFSSHSPEGSDGSSSDRYIELKFYHSMAWHSLNLINEVICVTQQLTLGAESTYCFSKPRTSQTILLTSVLCFSTYRSSIPFSAKIKCSICFANVINLGELSLPSLCFFSLIQMKCGLAPTGTFSIQNSWSLERKMQQIIMHVATTLLAKTKLTWH